MSRLPDLLPFTLMEPAYAHRLPSGVWRVLHGENMDTAVFVSDTDFKRRYRPRTAPQGHSVVYGIDPGNVVINGDVVEGIEVQHINPESELAAELVKSLAPPPRPQSFTIVIPTTPQPEIRPNAALRHGRWASQKANAEKKRLRHDAARCVTSAFNAEHPPHPLFPDSSTVRVRIAWEKYPTPHRPNGIYRKFVDPDALGLMCKGLLDGLVDAGLLDDDKHLNTTYTQEKDPDGLGFTEITVTMPERG
jgi:hypothetical protein